MTPTVDYPPAIDYMNKQSNIFWTAEEIKVDKDKQDILVNMTEAERHAVITTLKLFTKYEMVIGEEFWIKNVMNWFPRPEIQSMASLFGAMELAVHAPFYRKINEELNLATDEFYDSYIEDPVLVDRIKFLDDILEDDNIARSLGAFTFAEGAILYSSFAFLKHFQSQGKNKLLNVVAGINFSARDEALHSEAAGWLFQQYVKENDINVQEMEEYFLEIAAKVYDHEEKIIDKLFEKGAIEGITKTQMLVFVKSRINICMRNMGFSNIYAIDYNPVSDWFYKGINGYAMNDFFVSVGNQYQRNWTGAGFTF
jgi:ribonucleotide reductase beta subunit family protein with ferritin-like domain